MKTALWLLSLASAAMALPSGLAPRQSTYSDYLFVYFTGQSTANQEQIYLSVSNNNSPASWTQVNSGQAVLTSNVGTQGVRDPSLIRSQDGSKVWIIATDLHVATNGGNYDTTTGSKAIVVWESSDAMKTWSSARLITISPSNAGMTWAPDAIYDPAQGKYLVTWTCNLIGDGWYIMKSYTSDFVTFSTAEKYMSGAGMDVTIANAGGKFYRISKNGPNELIEEAVADSLAGSWSVVKDSIGSGAMTAGEGPLIFQDNADTSKWHLFIDNYTKGTGYVPFETTNIAGGQWTASSGYSLPPGNRHGYIIGITAAERANLVG